MLTYCRNQNLGVLDLQAPSYLFTAFTHSMVILISNMRLATHFWLTRSHKPHPSRL